MNIIKVSASVRSEPDWMEKLEDKDAVLQWVEQLKQRPDMAQEHIDYFVAELRYYAKLQRANTASGTKLSTVDMVWTMDIDDNDTLVRNFKHYVVNALESVPTGEQDWTTIGDIEPEKTENRRMYSSTSRIVSKCKVLRLISPSLYTLFLGLSPLLKHPITIPMEALNLPSLGHIYKSNIDWNQAIQKLNQRMIGDSSFVPISEDYLDNIDYQDRHWLPTDIHVNDDGSIDFKSYINNLHPGKYPEAYDSIAKVIAKCLPTLEQVMTDWEYKRNLRVPYSYDDCLRETMVHPDENIDFERGDYHEFEVALNAWRAGIVYTTPVPNAFVEPKRPLQPKSLQNRDLQVIVKMENLYSNPTGTNIPEEEWQGDGTGSEQIVATIIYYYDVENVEGFQM
ncbi:hypothetical protein GGI05_000808 [Coemansia sp. RSA 2603]|nr:hypothetical protein GGI05_000808 [Coemansia sp. RSA 2603]